MNRALIAALLLLSLACGPNPAPQDAGSTRHLPSPCAEEPDQATAVLAPCRTPKPSPKSSPSGASPSPSSSPTPTASPGIADACFVNGQRYCVLNPNVTQATIRSTICVQGWTGTIRPAATFTDQLKIQQLAALKLSDQNPADFEEDHRMPLTLGGNPTDPENLAPELRVHAGGNAEVKDHEESSLGTSAGPVCHGAMNLAQAQAKLVSDWLLPGLGYTK
jgi:hypothetical protein